MVLLMNSSDELPGWMVNVVMVMIMREKIKESGRQQQLYKLCDKIEYQSRLFSQMTAG